MADWMDAEIPEGRLLIGPTRAIPAGMRRYALGGPTCSPIWRDARVIKYLHGLDTIGRLRLRRVVQGVDFRVSDTQLIDQAMRDLAMGSLSAFLIPRAVAPLSPPPVDPPRPDQGDEDPPGQPAQWSVTDRVVATLRRCVPLLPREMQQAAKSLFTRETLYWLAGFLVVWAGGHLAGYGEAIDVILLGVGYAMVGWSVFQGLNDLGHGIALATTAKTQHDLDEAAKRTAAGLTILTINAIIALIAKVKPVSGGKRPVVEEPPPPPADPPLPPKELSPPLKEVPKPPKLSAQDRLAIDEAKADQVKWGYAADEWEMKDLKAGDKVYGGLPGQSAYYTDIQTLENAGGSRTDLFQSLQVKEHPEFGYRPKVGEYEVINDARVPFGTVKANPGLGDGGGSQYFISDYADNLRLVREIQLGE
ncbi:hypothetical protein [Nitrospirillum amazonense]|nr:hypothetical protein [Nitrospirillum amazonense]